MWVVGVVLAYDLLKDTFDFGKGVLLFCIVTLVAGAISRVTMRLLARPLALLHEGIVSAAAGRLEPIQVSKTGDEIEFLGGAINKMIAALAVTQQELIRNQELLEDRIRQRTAELEVAMREAVAGNHAKTAFLANISHELRTPMNGVIGMINIVLQSELDAEQRDQLETAQRCAFALLALLNDVLDLSKIEAGRMAVEEVPFDVRVVIDDCVKANAALATQKHIQLVHEAESDLPQQVSGDPLRLRQIVSNLVTNAVKFTDQGSVQVRTRWLAGCLEVQVKDTGIGIAEENQRKIFEMFTQADTSISRRFGGTGLGLAITKSLVELQNGSIRLESKTGAGSTFTIRIPYSSVSSPTPVASGTHVGRILVVEDNLVNQKLVSKILEKHGYSTEVCDNGQKALEALAASEFRLVLMDVHMPVMDGLETTRRIRQDPRWLALPIVAMTARALDGDKQTCLEAGMNGMLTKPIHAAHLLSVIDEFAYTSA